MGTTSQMSKVRYSAVAVPVMIVTADVVSVLPIVIAQELVLRDALIFTSLT